MSGGPHPSELAALVGTERVAEGAWQVDSEELTGRSTVTMRARARVDQDQVRQLPTGEANLILRGLAERVRIIKTNIPAVCTDCGPGPNRPSRGGRSPPGCQVRRQRLKLRAGQTAGRLLRSLTRRRPRQGAPAGRG